MKKISLIGSTGSIGKQTLDIARAHPEEISVRGLAAGGRSLDDLVEQIIWFKPDVVSVPTENDAVKLKELLAKRGASAAKTRLASGDDGLVEVATVDGIETLVTGVVGFLGVKPTYEAIKKGTTIALANKETLVAAGSVIMPLAKKHGAKIVPVDSEHSAIFQSLSGFQTGDIESIWLTGSGGPFRTWSIDAIRNATKDDALKHPNWSMGQKITIDSATMMNKGLEIIEAHWLFDLPSEKIEVLIHPQSILHSAVQFVDGSVIGQLGVPDMRLPIHYALFHPARVPSSRVPRLDLTEIAKLTFEKPDYEKFRCLKIAKEIASESNTLACVLNAANEVIVEAFLNDAIQFQTIPDYIIRVLDRHKATSNPTLDDILEADRWARHEAGSLVGTPV
jgi:1-deoxy-D-xylulose-5-phosphate reductoisomerase